MSKIQDFFDDQTIIKMGQVNVDWYHITKNRRTTILQQLDSFQYMDVYQQTMHIIECLYNNNIQKKEPIYNESIHNNNNILHYDTNIY